MRAPKPAAQKSELSTPATTRLQCCRKKNQFAGCRFWMYGRMRGTRVTTISNQPALGAWVSKAGDKIWVTLW